jgi:hypothetical protein
MAKVEVKLGAIADLTDEQTQKEYGISREALVADDYRLTQRLANTLRSGKVQAVWTYSYVDQPDGRMLVVFLKNVQHPRMLR